MLRCEPWLVTVCVCTRHITESRCTYMFVCVCVCVCGCLCVYTYLVIKTRNLFKTLLKIQDCTSIIYCKRNCCLYLARMTAVTEVVFNNNIVSFSVGIHSDQSSQMCWMMSLDLSGLDLRAYQLRRICFQCLPYDQRGLHGF